MIWPVSDVKGRADAVVAHFGDFIAYFVARYGGRLDRVLCLDATESRAIYALMAFLGVKCTCRL